MCARYETLPADLPEPFSHTRLTWVSPRLNETQREMFPGYVGPVLRFRRRELGLDAMRWGLIPFWAKDGDPRRFRSTFNARAETIDTTASFRESFARRRCLVPAAAFFEFPVIGGRKVRHRVAGAGGEPLMFAGVWDRWAGTDQEIYSYTIVTTEPVEELRWLHDRIPVALGPDARETWLEQDTSPSALRSLLVSPRADDLSCEPDENPGPDDRPLDLFGSV